MSLNSQPALWLLFILPLACPQYFDPESPTKVTSNQARGTRRQDLFGSFTTSDIVGSSNFDTSNTFFQPGLTENTGQILTPDLGPVQTLDTGIDANSFFSGGPGQDNLDNANGGFAVNNFASTNTFNDNFGSNSFTTNNFNAVDNFGGNNLGATNNFNDDFGANSFAVNNLNSPASTSTFIGDFGSNANLGTNGFIAVNNVQPVQAFNQPVVNNDVPILTDNIVITGTGTPVVTSNNDIFTTANTGNDIFLGGNVGQVPAVTGDTGAAVVVPAVPVPGVDDSIAAPQQDSVDTGNGTLKLMMQ